MRLLLVREVVRIWMLLRRCLTRTQRPFYERDIRGLVDVHAQFGEVGPVAAPDEVQLRGELLLDGGPAEPRRRAPAGVEDLAPPPPVGEQGFRPAERRAAAGNVARGRTREQPLP